MTPYDNDTFNQFIYDVRVERARQEKLWEGRKNSTFKWIVILVEEVGELAHHFLEEDPHGAYKELVQVAAVAVAWGEQIINECRHSAPVGMKGDV